jgi:hypothetical protein
MILVQLKERAFHIKLLPLFELELFEPLIQEFKQNKDPVSVNEKLRQINSLVDAISFEMLEKINEEI